MTTTHDKKVKDLLALVEAKRASLGVKPKAVWKTNGVFSSPGGTANINTINTMETCIEIAARLIHEQDLIARVCEFFGVEIKDSERAEYLKDALADLKLRASIIQWDTEKKKLAAMEKKLKDLRSEELKTENELTSLELELK